MSASQDNLEMTSNVRQFYVQREALSYRPRQCLDTSSSFLKEPKIWPVVLWSCISCFAKLPRWTIADRTTVDSSQNVRMSVMICWQDNVYPITWFLRTRNTYQVVNFNKQSLQWTIVVSPWMINKLKSVFLSLCQACWYSLAGGCRSCCRETSKWAWNGCK